MRVAGVGDIFRRRAEFHRLRGLRDHRAGDASDAPHTEHAVTLRVGDHLHEAVGLVVGLGATVRSEEHTSELQSLMRISYAVFCLKKKTITARSPLPNLNAIENIYY